MFPLSSRILWLALCSAALRGKVKTSSGASIDKQNCLYQCTLSFSDGRFCEGRNRRLLFWQPFGGDNAKFRAKNGIDFSKRQFFFLLCCELNNVPHWTYAAKNRTGDLYMALAKMVQYHNRNHLAFWMFGRHSRITEVDAV